MRTAFVAVLAVVAGVALAGSQFDDPEYWAMARLNTTDDNRQLVLAAMESSWKSRSKIGYTEGSQRWSGIDDHIHQPGVPPEADCSSWATWIFWEIWGDKKGDFVNGEDWKAGYTGTMLQHGDKIDCGKGQAGDLVIYGSAPPGEHVAMFTGSGGMTMGHGLPSLQEVRYDQMGMPILSCRNYLNF